MKLVDNQVEDAALFGQPAARAVEDSVVSVSHEHDAQHAEVGDEDVGWGVLHVPSRPHLCPVKPGEEVADVFFARLGRILLGDLRGLIGCLQGCGKTLDALGVWNLAALPVGRAVLVSWDRCQRRVAAHVDPVPGTVGSHPVTCSGRVESPA